MNPETGKWLIITGLLVTVAGIIVYFFHNKLQWPGRLPGDIRIEKENLRFYFPLTTMLIISIVLTIVINIIKRFLH
ncbi:MAG: DUF2905 domain-containing protein [Chitinophagaceae bacterium]